MTKLTNTQFKNYLTTDFFDDFDNMTLDQQVSKVKDVFTEMLNRLVNYHMEFEPKKSIFIPVDTSSTMFTDFEDTKQDPYDSDSLDIFKMLNYHFQDDDNISNYVSYSDITNSFIKEYDLIVKDVDDGFMELV